jgi:hypothetical protein
MRRTLVVAGLAAAAAGVAAAARGCAETAGAIPFADRIPVDAVLYVGTRDVSDLAARLRSSPLAHDPAVVPWLEFFARHEARLRGPAAIVARPVDGRLEWVLIVRAPAAVSGEIEGWRYEPDGDRLVVGATGDILRRFREAPMRRLDFAAPAGGLSVRVVPAAFASEAWSAWCARWRDFEAIDARVDVEPGALRMQALAHYAPAARAHAIRTLVHEPCRARPPGDVAAWTMQLEDAPRLWQEVLASLDADDRRLVQHESQVLAREFGTNVETMIPRLGPSWSLVIARSGAAGAAIEAHELPQLADMVRRSVADYARAMRRRGRSVRVDLEGNELCAADVRATLRLSEDRLEIGEPPPRGAPAEHHAGTVIDPAALLALEAWPCEATRAWRPSIERFRWARRAEAWTRYTDAGARVEARLTFGGP